jgi:hypothetical protein
MRKDREFEYTFSDQGDMELGLIISNARFECVVDRDGIKPEIGSTERDY